MNKAFMREPDQVDSPCPRCRSKGLQVGPQTLNAMLDSVSRRKLAESAYFCPSERCDVLYYDDFSSVVTREAIPGPIPVKDFAAPLCACFGTTREEIEDDVAEGVVTRTKAAVMKAQSAEAHCVTKAPNGRSCVSEIQGYFVKCRQRTQ
jgi:hypothetical protein